jgi:polyisoprenoid-binding protein YceI
MLQATEEREEQERVSTTVSEKQGVYAIDASHSNVDFTVRHLMISKVRGRFATVAGTIELAPDNRPSKVDVRIDAASIDTREPQRDAHLRSADFFDVEKYPELSFTSSRVEGTADDFKLYGNLTIHGVTREVALVGEFGGRVTDPWGGERVSFSAVTKINRKDFGLTWNQALETGGVVVSDEVNINLEVEALLQK